MMRSRKFDCRKSNDCKTLPGQCGVSDRDVQDMANDPELQRLFLDLSRTIYRLMEPGDAEILMRAELQGQSLSEIAADVGCSRVEATRRLKHAQKCFCRLVVMTVAQMKSE